MVISVEPRSLYDDWQLRRERVLVDSQLPDQQRRVQIHLLDYLLRRYRDAPEARSLARFPLLTEITINERAVLANHHLWPGRVGSTKNIFDVRERVSGIVNRMQSPPLADADEIVEDEVTEQPNPQEAQRSTPWRRWSANFERVCDYIFLFRWLPWRSRRPMSNRKLRRIFDRLANSKTNDWWLAEQVLGYDHPNRARYALKAWIERVRGGTRDSTTDRLYAVVRTASELNLDPLRSLLASENSKVRILAVEALGELGTLDDIALLSDLLTLPPQSDEHPAERNTLRMAIERIAQGAASNA